MEKRCIKCIAEDYFMNPKYSLNCAQATLLTLAEHYGIEDDNWKRITSPFGGGLCSTHVHVCGAVSGGLMAIGLLFDENQSAIGDRMLKYVEDRYGNINCPKILDIDFDNEEQVAAEKEPKRTSICMPLIIDICNWIVAEKTESEK